MYINVIAGTYSCLRTKMTLRREFSYYLLQLYIPSFMLVVVSWVSFWLDKDAVPARVTLGVCPILKYPCMYSRCDNTTNNDYSIFWHQRQASARLLYQSDRRVDRRLLRFIRFQSRGCKRQFVAFIFGALLEFALVNYAARKDMTLEANRRRRQNALTAPAGNELHRQQLLTNPQSYRQVMQQQNVVPLNAYSTENSYEKTHFPTNTYGMV
jgi:hypothetical protein